MSGTQKSEAFANRRHNETIKHKSTRPFFATPLWISLAVALLAILLLLQVLYTYRNWFAHQPITASLTRSFCEITECEITPQRKVNQIEILSKNVYGHPNDPNSLIVSASLKNQSKHKQPYPLIEVSFINKEEETVALQRFRPESYTKKNAGQEFFLPGETLTFRMKIADPGSEAIRFQFRFL
ncbi:MAG: MJ0042 family finger-like protein [uncultured Thiotrichaceae bacterium]|uniref:MJ0042 family finger-like protein n=1 Tax=uncultured Thiotrichaceae bacterium TaxID=298394 RepID=A0A6S6SCQ1_9GAMM|nr:MAG: MJ0042 family finger-like protein [uncultured Thiotrichaceae bacterium]